MKGYWNLARRGALVAIPALAVGLWLAAGRENLTKSAKAVQVEVRNDLFDDTIIETQQIPGPIFGFFPGLFDFVIPVLLVAAVLLVVSEWWSRRSTKNREVSA